MCLSHMACKTLLLKITCRHLQADRWKIVSAADDKTLKVSSM